MEEPIAKINGASGDSHRIMEAIAEVVAETGVLQGKRRRAVDSSVLDDAVVRQDTVTQLIAGIRRFGREIPGGKNWSPSALPGITTPAQANPTPPGMTRTPKTG
ncbi:hypothetical protein QFZ33_002430 [Arthrobacter globiformis]|uniref:hypothetical protein n=1 Tax=Arthrobacter globiformis TaxID=1665 RepID=UPI002791E306|nr:hypothetical protein [Arthrobacter globiformis]